jgi:hypothetical protein
MGFKMKGWSAFTKKDAPLKRIVEDEGPAVEYKDPHGNVYGAKDPNYITDDEKTGYDFNQYLNPEEYSPNEAPVPRMQNVDKSKAFIGPLKEWQQDVMDNIQIPMTPGFNREGEVQVKKYGDNEPVFPEEEKLANKEPDFHSNPNVGPEVVVTPEMQEERDAAASDEAHAADVAAKMEASKDLQSDVADEAAGEVSAADDITVKDKGRWKQRRDLRRKLRGEGMSRKEARLAARRAVPKKKLSLGFLQKK